MFDNYRLTEMSPNDYFRFCSHFNGNDEPQELIKNRLENTNELSVANMRKMMREGKQFDTPWIRLMDSGEQGTVRPYWQEGLHRMLAAGQEYGMDTKFPVYLGYEDDPWDNFEKMPMEEFLKHYDETRLKRYNTQKAEEEKKERERNQYWKEEAASHFKIPVEQVTPDQVKQYLKYLDKLFKDEWDE